MKVQTFSVGRLFTNCYIANCEQTREAIIIDPGIDNQTEATKIFNYIEKNALNLKLTLNTHGHPDHVSGNRLIKERFNTPILIHKLDSNMLGRISATNMFWGIESSPPADRLLRGGDSVNFGKIALEVIHTPGHTRGSTSFLGENEIFTGDTLFAGSIGRTDFPESSEREMKLSLKKLAGLPNHLVVYSGHGPASTIGEEKQVNPFLRWI